ncbi:MULTISPECIES: LysR family transcriptional regulator [Bacillaceae]|uniref:HTH lysR-type domain-containing protein n=1 Tax=Oceanobacillus caeni TaxID=405946 RepID=A0ABR5MN88_9BACI|nr:MULTISPECIES: LysR family transcriptional regulator [Bacillaceae]KPH78184.1 hypothetical protein AFL42_01955 [Oceanobacillus caeni]
MNESQLETFLTIAKYKSYSKAAVALGVTQPTITSRIKALEEILQCPLFTRIGHEIFLTKEGNIFVDYAKSILTYIENSKGIHRLVKDPIIKVGFSPGYTYSFIVELLKSIKAIGNIDIQIIEGYDSIDLNKRCLAGELDLVFTRENLGSHHDIISEYLFDNPLVAVLPKEHELCQKSEILLEDLYEKTIISFRRGSSLWKLIDQQLIRTKNLTRVDVENNEMLLQAVENKLGIGIVPELGINKLIHSEKIETRNIEHISQIPNKVYVQYRKTSQIEQLAKKIVYTIINNKYTGAGGTGSASQHY